MTQTSNQARIDRAQSENLTVDHIEGEKFKVTNFEHDVEHEHFVDLGQQACSCLDHVFRGTTCKHMMAAADASGVIELEG